MKTICIILSVIILALAGAGFVFYNNQKIAAPNDSIIPKGDEPPKENNNKNLGGMNRAPMAPSVSCAIEAEVLSAEKTMTELNGLALDAGMENSEYYLIKLKISNISTADSGGFGSCDEDYIKTVENKGIIYSLSNFEANPLTEGQKIKANVGARGDEYFSGYYLGNITNQ